MYVYVFEAQHKKCIWTIRKNNNTYSSSSDTIEPNILYL